MRERESARSFSFSSKSKSKDMVRYHSAPFPSCLRPPATGGGENHHHLSLPPPPPPSTTTAAAATTSTASSSNLTTYLYHTRIGLFSLTWSRNLFGRSLRLHLLPNSRHSSSPASSTLSFHLNIKPMLFWNTSGSKKLTFFPDPTNPRTPKTILLHYDFTRSKFGSGPEPDSGFYIAAVYNNEMTLLVGDSDKEAYLKTKARIHQNPPPQALVVRREHVSGNRLFATKTKIAGREREILIDSCPNSTDPRLSIKIDSKRVLQIKHLKWKFRGSERFEFDGQPIRLSWDAYNWLSEDESSNDGYALFTFRFEKKPTAAMEDVSGGGSSDVDWSSSSGGEQRSTSAVCWSSSSSVAAVHSQDYSDSSCGIEYERKKMKMKKRLLMKTRSSSSSSLSSASSGCGSVMDWESVEENELKGPTGFSLLVYAWKS